MQYKCTKQQGNSLNGWYIGTSTEHYRCHHIFCTKTCSEWVSDTILFQRCHITSLQLSTEDTIMKALRDIKSILLKQQNTIGNNERRAIMKLHNIFRDKRNISSKKLKFQDLPNLLSIADKCNTAPILADTVQTPRVIMNMNSKGGYGCH